MMLEMLKSSNLFQTDPSADDLIELARVEMRRAEEMEADENLQDEEIRKRLTQITEAPPGKCLL